MHLKIELVDGTELIANEVRQFLDNRYGNLPNHQFTINFGKANTLSTDEILEVFSRPGNTEKMKVYRRESVLGEDNQEQYGEFELVEEVEGFVNLIGIYKDFFTKQINIQLSKVR